MIARPLLALALTAAPAHAAERHWGIGSFDRLRVDAPVEVRITAGAAPRATASAGDPKLLEQLRVEVNGGTMTVRLLDEGRAPSARAGSAPLVVTLSTPQLASVMLTAPGRVTVSGLKADRAMLSVTGTGALSASGIDAQSVVANLLGSGAITLAGRTTAARLSTNGPGLIDAAALTAGSATIVLDGAGETRAAARYDAQVTTTGLGRVTVTGNPKCTVRAPAGGPVRCGVSGS